MQQGIFSWCLLRLQTNSWLRVGNALRCCFIASSTRNSPRSFLRNEESLQSWSHGVFDPRRIVGRWQLPTMSVTSLHISRVALLTGFRNKGWPTPTEYASTLRRRPRFGIGDAKPIMRTTSANYRYGSTPKSLWWLAGWGKKVLVPNRYLGIHTVLDGDIFEYYGMRLHELRSRCNKTGGIEGETSRRFIPDPACEELNVLCGCSGFL